MTPSPSVRLAALIPQLGSLADYKKRELAEILAEFRKDETVAVELLDALRWLTEMAGYAQVQVNDTWRQDNGGDLENALDQARAAIAEAEGRAE